MEALVAALGRQPDHFPARLLFAKMQFLVATRDDERIAAIGELQRASDLLVDDLETETYGVFCLPERPYPSWVFKRITGFVLFDDDPPRSAHARRALLGLFPCR